MFREAVNSIGIRPREEKDGWAARLVGGSHEESAGPHRALLIGGLLVLGLGLLTWYYVGRDVSRYLRLRSM
jgi:hypothetical protein